MGPSRGIGPEWIVVFEFLYNVLVISCINVSFLHLLLMGDERSTECQGPDE